MQVVIQFFKEMAAVKIAISAAIVAFLILFAIFFFKVSDGEMSVLYTDLDLQESAKIAEELDSRKIRYKVISEGKTIQVSKSSVVNTRLVLAQAGLPSNGSIVGYEIFDKEDSIGSTNFSQN